MSKSAQDVFRTVAFIFARGGSKGLPGKNVKLLGGKPLIAHAIETAQACTAIETVIVSTDDDEIRSVAVDFGAEVPFERPAELASDTAPEWKAWQHAIAWFQQHRGEFNAFVSLPATAPFRSVDDVQRCLQCLQADNDTDMVVTGSEAARSPYFNMVKLNSAGYVTLAADGPRLARRQDAPKLYDLTTVAYAARPEFVMMSNHMFDGNMRIVEVPIAHALDIDTPLDFEIAEFLMSRQSKSSPLANTSQ